MAIRLYTLPLITIATGGVNQAASSQHIAVTSLTLQTSDDNTGDVYVGDSGVTTGNGLFLPAGSTTEITGDAVGRGGTEEFYLDEIYVISATSGNKIRAAAFVRRG